jgi:hypothetical protein
MNFLLFNYGINIAYFGTIAPKNEILIFDFFGVILLWLYIFAALVFIFSIAINTDDTILGLGGINF